MTRISESLSPGDVCIYHQPGGGQIANGDRVYQPGEMFLVLGFIKPAERILKPTTFFIEFLCLSDNIKCSWHPWCIDKHLKKLENE